MAEEITFRVPDMSCEHCKTAIELEVEAVPGVERVDVDLETKLVGVHGENLSDEPLRAAIENAGYEAD